MSSSKLSKRDQASGASGFSAIASKLMLKWEVLCEGRRWKRVKRGFSLGVGSSNLISHILGTTLGGFKFCGSTKRGINLPIYCVGDRTTIPISISNIFTPVGLLVVRVFSFSGEDR